MTSSLAQVLPNRVALVAGADGRHGRAVAVALAEAGASVALVGAQNDRSAEFAINSIANELWAIGRPHLTMQMDIDQPESVGLAVRQALAEFGRIDLLLNLFESVGEQPFSDLTQAAWQRSLDLNLGSVYLTSHAVSQAMLERDGGSILNVVSSAAHGRARAAPLAAAQAGVIALSRSLALEWEGRIAVNCAVTSADSVVLPTAALIPFLAATLARQNSQGLRLTGQELRL